MISWSWVFICWCSTRSHTLYYFPFYFLSCCYLFVVFYLPESHTLLCCCATSLLALVSCTNMLLLLFFLWYFLLETFIKYFHNSSMSSLVLCWYTPLMQFVCFKLLQKFCMDNSFSCSSHLCLSSSSWEHFSLKNLWKQYYISLSCFLNLHYCKIKFCSWNLLKWKFFCKHVIPLCKDSSMIMYQWSSTLPSSFIGIYPVEISILSSL